MWVGHQSMRHRLRRGPYHIPPAARAPQTSPSPLSFPFPAASFPVDLFEFLSVVAPAADAVPPPPPPSPFFTPAGVDRRFRSYRRRPVEPTRARARSGPDPGGKGDRRPRRRSQTHTHTHTHAHAPP